MSHAAVIVGNSITHSVGQIFQPIFTLFASLLALIYSVVPNYAISITILTMIIMGALTPLTVKSTKSMLAMQRLQPEIKKLQQKYKGPENRQQLNEEMMRLYREEKINPAGGCLPMFLQFPFLIILYNIILGLAHTENGHAAPRYIPHSSKMYHNLVDSGGHMVSFGVDLALKPFSANLSFAQRIPYFTLIAFAVALQYIQMNQMNKRNPASQQNSSMMKIQKFMPLLFAYIYFIIPAAVLIYMVVSTIIRIVTQVAIFKKLVPAQGGTAPKVVPRNDAGSEKELPAKGGTGTSGSQTAPAKPAAKNPNTSKNKRKRKDR